MTHSFHCCAFQFPSRHDPLRHAQRMQELQKWREQCNDEQGMRKNDAKQLAATDEIVSDDRTVDTVNTGVFGYDILLKQNIKESNRFVWFRIQIFKSCLWSTVSVTFRFDSLQYTNVYINIFNYLFELSKVAGRGTYSAVLTIAIL